MNEDKNEKIEIQSNDMTSNDEKHQDSILDKILNVIKKILLVITSPIWFPWKVLFFKKEGNKFNEVDSKTQMFRIIRSPLTKTLKFIVFIFVILLEVLLVYKIRYSPITYPITRNSVRGYYLNENRMDIEGVDENYKSDFEVALDYIDTWDLDEKNKMNVILDSDLVKQSLKYTDNKTISYILTKFNNDAEFRENVRIFVKNINSTITRFINEIPEKEFNELNNFLGPIITVSSWAIDYAGALDIGGAVFNWAIPRYNIGEKSLNATPANIEKAIKTGLDYMNGKSLETVRNYWK